MLREMMEQLCKGSQRGSHEKGGSDFPSKVSRGGPSRRRATEDRSPGVGEANLDYELDSTDLDEEEYEEICSAVPRLLRAIPVQEGLPVEGLEALKKVLDVQDVSDVCNCKSC